MARRPFNHRVSVDRVELQRNLLGPVCARTPLPSRPAHLTQEVAIEGKTAHRLRKVTFYLPWMACRDLDPRLICHPDSRTAQIQTDHGSPQRHGFQDRSPARVVERWMHEHVRLGELAQSFLLGDLAPKADTALDAEGT